MKCFAAGNAGRCAVAMVLLVATGAFGEGPAPHQRRLEKAYDALIRGMEEAGQTLVDPRYFPPAPTERNLAEGYRYLLGHLGRVIEREMRLDPRFPEFHRAVDMLRKHTGENPDAMYLVAPIDATGVYRVTGRAGDTTEWRTSERTSRSGKAPRLVTFQVTTGSVGETGTLEEMARCETQTLDFLNSLQLEVDAQGRFEILVASERPAGHDGPFLASRKEMSCARTGERRVREGAWLVAREIFSDWEREVPLELDIVRVDAIGENRPPITVEEMATRLEQIGRIVPSQMRFWNQLMEFPLEMRRDANGDGRRSMPVNGMNPPAPPFTAGGAAGARQLYSAGIFELEPEEALLVRVETPVAPHYIGFQLNNLWMEGPDQQNWTSSLSGGQLAPASDGARYYVIAHEDPGVPGWVATTGLSKGFQAMRFVFREDVPSENLPRVTAERLPLAEVRGRLPEDTPSVSVEERRRQVATRQRHIKARWRAF